MTTTTEITTLNAYINTTLSLSVTVEASDEAGAADQAWQVAEEYAQTLQPHGDHRLTSVDASFDGVGADEITEMDSADA